MAPSATATSVAQDANDQNPITKMAPTASTQDQEIESECQLPSLSRGPNPLSGVNFRPYLPCFETVAAQILVEISLT